MTLRQTLLLSVFASLAVAQNPFATNTRIQAGEGPSAFTVADFNGDGKQDIAVANQTDKTISILLGNGSGGFTNAPGSPMAMLPGQSDGPIGITAGDFNRDGKVDLAYVENRRLESYYSALMVRLGVGDGTFLAIPGNVAPSPGGVASGRMRALDMDGDGFLDLAIDPSPGAYIASPGHVIRGDGTGRFSGNLTGNTTAADLNGDGRLDYVTTSPNNGDLPSLVVSIANLSGSFDNRTYSPGSFFPGESVNATTYQIRIVDFDHDGAMDIVMVTSVFSFNTSRVQAWRGDGAGGFVLDFQNGVGVRSAYSLAFADFDGDGIEDWAVRTDNTIEIGLLRLPTKTVFPVGISIPIGPGPGDIAIADFNTDGKPDIVALDMGSNDLSLLLSGTAIGTRQTITFPPIPGVLANASPFTISATASSGLPVTITSGTPSVCTIAANIVTVHAQGTCSLTATQAGNSFYQAAIPVSLSFAVNGLPQIITVAPIGPKPVGSAPFTPQVTTTSGLPVNIFLTSPFTGNLTICSVTNNVVTILGPGTCYLTISQDGNSIYSGGSVNVSFEVTGTVTTLLPQTLTFNPIADREESANGFVVSVTASSNFRTTLTSNAPSVCTISPYIQDSWTVTTISSGNCSLTGSQDGAGIYVSVSITRTFNVTPPVKKVLTITITPKADVSLASQTTSLAAASGTSGTVLASSTPLTCSVSSNNITIYLIAAGACTITATNPGNDYYLPAAPVSVTFNIINGPTQTQTIVFPPISNYALGTAPFALSAATSSYLTVVFSSTTPSICTVAGANVTLLEQGSCSIVASQPGDRVWLPAPTITRTFTVVAPSSSQGQSLSGFTIQDHLLSEGSFTVTITATSGLPVILTSQTPGTCSVSGLTITLLALGQCTFTATQPGNSTYQPAPAVTRSFNVLAHLLQTQSTFFSFPGGNVTQGSVTLTPTAWSGLPVTLSTTTLNYCTVSGYTVYFIAPGSCTIVSTQPGNSVYAPSTYSSTGSISQGNPVDPQTLNFASLPDRALGTGPFFLSATTTSLLTPSFVTTTSDICTVSTQGVLTLLQLGQCSVTAFQNGSTTFAAAPPITRTFNVTAGGNSSAQPQTINFPTLSDRTLSQSPGSLTATASSGLPVTFTSETPSVCTVSPSSVALVSTGTCIVTASQPGNATWAPAPSISRSFAVTSPTQTQTLIFTMPSALTRPATAIPLNATISPGPGTITYTTSTPDVCSIFTSTISMIKSGTCSVTATANPTTPGGGQPISITRLITVTGISQTIAFPEIANRALNSGNFTPAATASSGLFVLFNASPQNVCSAAGATISLLAVGTCTLTAVQSGDYQYDPAPTVTRSFQITSSTLQSQTITFGQPTDWLLAAGDKVLLVLASSGLSVTVTSSTPGVCTVNGLTVHPLTIGTCTVTASQPGNSTYSPATPITHSFSIIAGSTAPPSISSIVNAASYTAGSIAPSSYVAIFGKDFGPSPRVTVRDSGGILSTPSLVYTSDTQINLVWPASPLGSATVTVQSEVASTDFSVTVATTVPALFAANGAGTGLAAANVIIVNNDGSVTTRLVTDGPIPVLAGTEIYLVLYGTGIRGHAPNGVTAKVAGRSVDLLYAGAQGAYPGLDQINLRVPLTVGGFGSVEIELTVDGSLSNKVTATFR